MFRKSRRGVSQRIALIKVAEDLFNDSPVAAYPNGFAELHVRQIMPKYINSIN